MGKWVILLGGGAFGPESIRRMRFQGYTSITDWGRKQLDAEFPEGKASFQFDYNGDIRNDYDPKELSSLPWPNPQCVILRYTSLEVLSRIISAEDFPEDVLIDTDGAEVSLPAGWEEARGKGGTGLAIYGKSCYTESIKQEKQEESRCLN